MQLEDNLLKLEIRNQNLQVLFYNELKKLLESKAFAKYNSNNASTSQQTIITPLQQEENYHTGENKGYMVGMYNGIEPIFWQTTGGILDYVSDTFVNATTVNAPIAVSSASGVEYGKFEI